MDEVAKERVEEKGEVAVGMGRVAEGMEAVVGVEDLVVAGWAVMDLVAAGCGKLRGE